MTSLARRRTQAASITERASAPPDQAPQRCAIFGCHRHTQRSSAKGLSEIYCGAHVQHQRSHGHPWRPSYKGFELKPYRAAAKRWLRDHKDDPRVVRAVHAMDGLLRHQPRSVTADYHRGLDAVAKARNCLAMAHKAGKTGEQLAEIVLTIHAAHRELGPFGSPPWLPVQIAKLAKRLRGASGTIQRNHEGVPMRLVYPNATAIWKRGFERWPRAEGRFMVRLGEMIADRASSLTDPDTIQEVLTVVHAARHSRDRSGQR